MITFTKRIFVDTQKATPKKSEISSDELMFQGLGSEPRQSKNRSMKGAVKLSRVDLSFNQMRNLYVVNPWVRACVDKIVNRCANHEPIVRPVSTAKVVEEQVKKETEILQEFMLYPNTNGESLTSIRKKVHRDSLILDAAAIEKVENTVIKNNVGTKSFEIFSLPGDTIKPNPDRRGILPDNNEAYVQIDEREQEVATWGKNDIIYLVANPQSDRVFGLSPLETLAGSVADELNAAYHNSQYFENNATPRFILMFSNAGGIGNANSTVKRFREWWDQELRGNPHRPMFVSADKGEVNFQRVSMNADEMQFYEYSRWLLSKILSVYHVPPLLIGVIDATMGKLNSEQQTVLFKEDAIKPQLRLFAAEFNTEVVYPKTGFGFRNVFLDFDLDLVDRDKQARIHERQLRNGIFTINDIRHQLGEFEVPWGTNPYLPLNMAKVDDDGLPIVNQGAGGINDDLNRREKMYALYEQAIEKDFWGSHPVGWEHMNARDRIDVLEKMVKNREKALQKSYSYAK